MAKNNKIQILVFALIIITAFVFRFQHIQSIPPGLYHDEAMNGNNALVAYQTGDYKIFYTDNNGRGGLFINLIALGFKIFGQDIWSIRVIPAIIGFLTVIGLYLLTRQLLNWQIASIASFYLAVSFWHVNFSRIAFAGIMVPFLMVFGFYFLWKGLKNLNIWNYILSGLFFGLGIHTYIAFRFVPFIVALVLAVYWWRIKKDYNHNQYIHMRNQLIKGFAMLFLISFFTALPILIYFYQHPADFFGRANQVSIFNAENPLKEFIKALAITLASFNFVGDFNWRHNFSGSPLLLWPVGVFFVIGLIKSFIKCWKKWKEHKHFSTLHTLTLSWFFIMLLPSVLTNEGIPHALRSIGVIPIVMIFAAEGTWWLFETIKHWYRNRDLHINENIRQKENEAGLIVGIVLIIFLISIGMTEYNKYFKKWALRSEVKSAFSADFVELGEKLNKIPVNRPKYVIVNAGGVLADAFDPFTGKIRGIPMPAQTVMFVTKTYTPKLQKEKNLFYILPGEENKIKQKNALIIPLIP